MTRQEAIDELDQKTREGFDAVYGYADGAVIYAKRGDAPSGWDWCGVLSECINNSRASDKATERGVLSWLMEARAKKPQGLGGAEC